MAKSKHTINDIQKALLSSTKYLKEVEKEDSTPRMQDVPQANLEPSVNIDPLILKKFSILSRYLGEPAEDLINNALNHFLRLKSLQLDKAIQQITSEE
ncbi:MAG TPA: hypothetical protein PL017_13745 [Tenuifilaceae bacterium]|nr:hypothetical protein [Tenuifilaceae bacterium]HPE18236.1 hypothetical protein [Tenuifilaceae bacterium]HPJ47150.1 hypothetical protein [Tenuifilaceae bacterium]HPQ35733.1 hypothetical protein [Tenuifilaceae bacterium]HRX69234.1 hypothetical protein [Tenuifilaceae bacterium]